MPEPHKRTPSPAAPSAEAPVDGDKSDDAQQQLAAVSPDRSPSPSDSTNRASSLSARSCQADDESMAEAARPASVVGLESPGRTPDVEPSEHAAPSPVLATPAPPAPAATDAAPFASSPFLPRSTVHSRPASRNGLRRLPSSGWTTPVQPRSHELGAAAADHPPPAPAVGPPPPNGESSRYTLPPERPLSSSLADLRACSETKDCLYPGSTFIGTQKSGRNSYDVTLQIMDVNLADSTCSGSLKICGLTQERPELTTFFEGEIIGPRFGFLTDKWEATKSHDLAHWQRFPLFRPLLPRVRQTETWTMPSPIVPLSPEDEADPASSPERFLGPSPDSAPAPPAREGGMFMRFKEKCLLPDYRIKSISGASFEGFYYICLEFDPASDDGQGAVFDPARGIYRPASRPGASSRATPGRAATPPVQPSAHPVAPPPVLQSTAPRRVPSSQQSSSTRPSRPPSRMLRSPPGAVHDGKDVEWGPGIMTGFYFHVKNSEPFQELSLRHVKEDRRPAFEFC